MQNEKLTRDTETVIYTETDPNIFGRKRGNRVITPDNVLKVCGYLHARGWGYSTFIIVNSDMEVLDGQHRVEALKRFKRETGITLRFKFIIDDSMDTLERIISFQDEGTKWSPEDYARSYVELGYRDYSIYLKFRERFMLSHTATLLLLANGIDNKFEKQFKSGNIKIHDIDNAYRNGERIMELKDYFNSATDTNFIRAMIFWWKQDLFSHDTFMRGVNANRNGMYACKPINDYKIMIMNVYNFRLGKNNRLHLTI